MCSPRHHSCTAIPLLLCSALFYSPVLASFYFDITDTTSFLHSLTYSLVCDICGGYQILLANWRPPSCTHSLTDSLVCDIYDGGYQILLANRRPASYTHSLTHSCVMYMMMAIRYCSLIGGLLPIPTHSLTLV